MESIDYFYIYIYIYIIDIIYISLNVIFLTFRFSLVRAR